MAGRSPENSDYLDFYKQQEKTTRDREFIDSHTDHWVHGLPRLHSVMTYSPHELAFEKSFYYNKQKNTERYFSPEVSMSELNTQTQPKTRLSSQRSTEGMNDSPETSDYASTFKNDQHASPFSGLLHFPAFSYTLPGQLAPQGLSQYVYQAHFEVGEITYMFGGLCVDPLQGLRQLGILRSTDISRISIHLPCEMPPFVNKEVLMSPVVCQNLSFITFNPTRSTVAAHDLSTFEDLYPAHLCEMRGTQISDHQVFFSGGFEVKVDSVTYMDDIDRWIVRKSIVLNKNGYILDVRRLNFTKIDLKSKLELYFGGRLGAALVSSCFAANASRKDNLLLLPAAMNSASSNGKLAFNTAEVEPVDSFFENDLKTPVSKVVDSDIEASTPVTLIATANTSTLSANASTLSANTSTLSANTSTLSSLVSTANTNSSNCKSSTARSSISRHASSRGTDASILRSVTSASSSSKVSARPSDSKSPTNHSASGSTSHKMSSVFLKSSKLFHRSASVRQGNHGSSYSNHVKQHRSRQQGSRPTSPLLPTKKSSHSRSASSESPDSDSSTSSAQTTLEVKIASPQPRKVTLLDKDDGKPDIMAVSSPVDSEESDNYQGYMLNDALKVGVLLVCLYIVGGFTFAEDDSDVKTFVACNDLLKIELIIDDARRCVFHPEALLFSLSPHKGDDIWPEPRGYFAAVLIDNYRDQDACDLDHTTIFEQNDNDSAKSYSNLSDVISSSERSTAKSSRSTNGNVYFERKSLIVQGGVDENYNVFSDFHVFNFSTGTWLIMLTYAFDYFDVPKQPFEDEVSEKLTFENQLADPELKDAELRCCHHKAMLCSIHGKESLVFVGGLTNDYLRHFDKSPYKSERFDVSRLSRLLFSSTNSNLLRLPVLNLNSQLWRFTRFFYDLTETISQDAMDMLMSKEYLRNSRLSLTGGAFSIVGKQLTLCHGFAEFVPEKSEDFGKIEQDLGSRTILLGGHFHLIYPGI